MRLSSSCSALTPIARRKRSSSFRIRPRLGEAGRRHRPGSRPDIAAASFGNLAIRHGLADTRGIAREHGVEARRAVGAVELGGDAKAECLR